MARVSAGAVSGHDGGFSPSRHAKLSYAPDVGEFMFCRACRTGGHRAWRLRWRLASPN